MNIKRLAALSLVSISAIAAIGCGGATVPVHQAIVIAPEAEPVDVKFGNPSNAKPSVTNDGRFKTGWESLSLSQVADAFNSKLSYRGINASTFTYTAVASNEAQELLQNGGWVSDDMTSMQFSVLAEDAFFVLATAPECGDLLLLVPSTRMFKAGSNSGIFERTDPAAKCASGSGTATAAKTKLTEIRLGEQITLF